MTENKNLACIIFMVILPTRPEELTRITVKRPKTADKLHKKDTAMGKYSLQVQPKV